MGQDLRQLNYFDSKEGGCTYVVPSLHDIKKVQKRTSGFYHGEECVVYDFEEILNRDFLYEEV
jgi:hypothetical protein